MIGQTISHYQILEKLGEGGMGVVFKARDTRLNRFVALKVLPADRVADEQRKKRFVQEAQAASALNHPNIITVYEIERIPGGADFIAMEFIEGQTLRALLAEPVPLELATQIGRQVAEALCVSHAAGIVHRDIKPENIMLRPDGYVKVLDFGLALLVHESTPDSLTRSEAISRTGGVLGTVAYASPEQARGEPVGGAGDVFSLGLVLYELVTGRHPYRTASAVATLQAILSEPPLPPSRLQPELPAPVEHLILLMLEKEPTRRPTAAEVLGALAEPGPRAAGVAPARKPPAPRRPTVGHEKQRAALRSFFESACAGRGLLVCLTGDAGIGKTTLVDDFLAQAAETEPFVGRGRCSERLAGAEAYLPILEVLESLIRGPMGAQLARTMKRLAPTWYFQVAPQLDDSSADRLMTETRGASQERMKRELHVFLEESSRFRPLVLFLDDLHWADLSTVDVLAYLGYRCPSMRLLIVAAYRPTDLLLSKHPFLQVKLELQSRGACRELPIELLSRQDVEEYLELCFPKNRFPKEFGAVVHGRTEGNPLFMVDLLRFLQDRDAVQQEGPDGCWVLTQSLGEVARGLPESVRSTIQRKIDRLAEEDRRLLVAASVLGYEFDSAVVSKALAMDAGEAEERLDVLERVHRFVQRVQELELPDFTLTVRYRFVHVLYQNAFYDSLQPARRAALSAAAAEALVGFHGEQNPSVASQLAFLFESARDFSRAVDYYVLAAQQAFRVSANQEAAVLARRGLKLLEAIADSAERARKEIALQIALGTPLTMLEGYASPEVEAAYGRALALCRESSQNVEMFQALLGLYAFYFFRSQQRTAFELLDQCVRLAEDFQNRELQVWAHFMAASVLSHVGDPEAGLKHADRCLGFYDRRKHSSYVSIGGFDAGLVCGCQSARLLWLCGYPDQARVRAHETVALGRELSHPYSIVFTLYFAAWIHVYRREPQLVQPLARQAIATADEQGFALPRWWASALLGSVLAEQGQLEEGIALLKESLASLRSVGVELLRPEFLGLLGAALLNGGQLEDGSETINEAISVAEATGERYYDAELYRLKGELLLRRPVGAHDEAEALFRRAIDVAQRQKAKCFELRSTSSLCRLLQRQGRAEEVRPTLRAIYGWFTEGFDTPDLREARELLEGRRATAL